jgi:hypothetical protein
VAINPILQTEQKVLFLDRIDIATIYPPKARTITLEPLSRKARSKQQPRKAVEGSDRNGRSLDSQDPSSNHGQSETSSSRSLRPDADTPRSPSLSEFSFDSASYGPGTNESNGMTARQSDASRTNGSTNSFLGKTITATVEPLVGGCLRHDSVPVRVFVNHTKFVQSLYGVIITLYRQARVDMHPAIPLGPTEKGKEGKFEDYYPKSITGLGGLSLSGAGSSHVFRKDLSQVMLPLVVNPGSLTAEVNGKVHIPDDVFPTISNVPGAMIGFRYYVEVLVDIQGRLATQDRNLANWGGLASTSNHGTNSTIVDGERSTSGFGGSAIVDTARLRRDKGVISSTFEIIVGTIDSERHKGKRKMEKSAVLSQSTPQRAQPSPPQPYSSQTAPPLEMLDVPQAGEVWYGNEGEYGQQEPGYGYDDPQWRNHDVPPTSWHDFQQDGGAGAGTANFALQAPSYMNSEPPVPMPRTDDETGLSEKERMRRAEARLLPSQAPGMEVPPDGFPASAPFLPDEQEAGPAGYHTPTAPYLPDDQHTDLEGDEHVSTPCFPNAQPPSAPPIDATTSNSSAFLPAPMSTSSHAAHDISLIPSYEAAASSPPVLSYSGDQQPPLPPTDDKRELQRRVLFDQQPVRQPPRSPLPSSQTRSGAPPSNYFESRPPFPTPSAPTAPTIDEVDDENTGLYDTTTTAVNDSHADAFGSSGLPRYER